MEKNVLKWCPMQKRQRTAAKEYKACIKPNNKIKLKKMNTKSKMMFYIKSF